MRRLAACFVPTFVVFVALAAVAPSAYAVAANWTWVAKGKLTGNVGSLDAVECPTARLCVAGGGQAIWVTTAPTGRTTGWRKVNVSQVHPQLGRSYIYEVSCPTAAFCAVGDSNTNVITTTTPASTSPSAWLAREVPNLGVYAGIGGLSCPSPMLCAATDINGGALTSANPLGGIYTTARISDETNAGIYDLDCAGTVCVSVQSGADIWTTADASAQPATWRKVRLGSARRTFNAAACAAANLCLVAGNGPLRVTTNLAGGPAAWRAIALAGVTKVDHASCRPGLCTVTAGTDVWWSATPAIARSWKKSTDRTRRVILSDSSCPTVRMCVLVDVGSNVWVGTR